MGINEKIFKAYDIRGTYPAELNEEAAYAIGRALARRSRAKTIVVGSDMRLSGPALKVKLIEGINDEGADVIDVGLVSVDTIYFVVGILKYEAGIMITASHNPPEYNGFKMVLKDMAWIRGQELKDDVLNLPFEPAGSKGKVTVTDILPQYIQHVLSFCDVKKISPLKIVVDAGNGMAGKIMPLLQSHLPVEIIPLNFKLDGSFPAHLSNPLLPQSQAQLQAEVLKQQADLGVVFDGDTDRLVFVDEKGQVISADHSLLLMAKEFLNREPGAKIVYNLICSKIVPEKIIEWGGQAVRCAVGYVNVSAAVRESGAAMGGELSAHYCFRDNAYADSGFISFVLILQLLSESNRPLSEIMSAFHKYVKTPEINFEVDNRDEIITIIGLLKEKYADGAQDEVDGLTVQYPNWWFNARPSNTEPLLRITAEADNQPLLDQKINELQTLAEEFKK
ncbi:MAG: phosphomannomutase/phosphoglucomutase [Candidatus Buchananbacteria bacterium]